MLTQTFFDSSNTARIETSYKRFKQIALLVLLVGVPVQFLIAFLASQKSRVVFWPVIIFGFGMLIWAFYAIFLKTLKLLKQGLSEQIKLVGELQVSSKSEKDKRLLIGFESTDLDKISLTQGVFEKINIGDTLTIEISKYAKHIFKLSKDGEAIMNNN